ncbi:MAG: AI-2E family transporter [Actinobacteria bacterium]|nr:AI-2E family transporter [Actinomycetota bacterium]
MKTRKSPKVSQSFETVKKIGVSCWAILGIIVIVGLFFYLLYLMKFAMIPLIIAAAIAYLLTPLGAVFQKKAKLKKIWAVALTYIIFLGVIFVIFFFITPVIVNQLTTFIHNIPSYIKNLDELLNNFLQNSAIIKSIENIVGKDVIPKDTSAITQYIIDQLNLRAADIFKGVTTVTRSVFNIVVTLIISLLLGFYILKDGDKIRTSLIKAMPVKFKHETSLLVDKISLVASRYIRGQIMVSIIVGILCTIVLAVLKIDLAFLLGFIAGVFNLIPLLGPFIGGIPAALVALFASPLKALLVIVLFVAIQQLDNYVISPNIMKYQVGIHPGITIFSLVAGGALFGMLGLFLAVPLAAIAQEILRYYVFERRKIVS